MSGNVRRYFFTFFPLSVLIALPMAFSFSILATIALGVPLGVPVGIALAALYGAGFTWLLAWIASRRRALARPQEAKGLCHWRYLDLAAPYPAALRACADILRSICKTETTQDPARGVLVAETRANLQSWGSEISFWIDSLDQNYTRVQVLSRPVVPINRFDFGANQRHVNRAIEMLRTRFSVIAEG
ncbi:MAG TPA: hypothetical protein VF952_17865 [Chloroflexia bacterium]